jgi:5-methylcytosine-specific restriction endonuclease McrA
MRLGMPPHAVYYREKSRRYRQTDSGKLARRQQRARRGARQAGGSTVGTFAVSDWHVLVARSPRCHWCKKPFNGKRRPTHDHVIPLSKGGPNSPENSVCACMECNARKGARFYNPATGQGILL